MPLTGGLWALTLHRLASKHEAACRTYVRPTQPIPVARWPRAENFTLITIRSLLSDLLFESNWYNNAGGVLLPKCGLVLI